MSFLSWFRPPRQLLTLFVLITLVPSVLLFALGWRLFQQDRAIGLQRLQERREQTADLVVSGFEHSLNLTES